MAWLAIGCYDLGSVWIGLAAGATQHLVIDIPYNGKHFGMKIISCFFAYRAFHGFRREKIMRW